MLNLIYRLVLMSILSAVAPKFALASDCDEIRLDQPGSAFDKIPVYNQKDTRGVDSNLCYAIASSQLIDEYRFRMGDSLKQISSPLSLAVAYKKFSQDRANRDYKNEPISGPNITNSLLGGGFIEESLLTAHEVEICDQNAIEKEAGLIFSDVFTKESAQQFVEKALLTANAPILKSFSKLDYLTAVKANLENKCQGSFFTLNKIYSESLGGSYDNELLKLMQEQSDPLKTKEEKVMLVKEFAQKYNKTVKIKTFKEKIKNLLHQKIPVGFGYLGKVLRSNVPFDDTAFHASIITGQRKNPSTGICELLVRDSYGSNCKDQRDDDRYALPCENGSVWVSEDKLLGDTSKLTWIP